jgi:hypothetical protein
MSVKVPTDAKFGFLVAIGVLAALAAWSFLSQRLPAVVSGP